MPWKPSAPGEVPTLGWYVIDWMTDMLAAPGRAEYEPFVPYREQEDFLLRFYEINPDTGRFRYDRGLLGRPRGWGKSPILAALACVEALGDVLFDGWDANGQPVGRPWRTVRTPIVHIAAVSEMQTRNTWQPLLEMIREGPIIDEFPDLDPMDSFVALPKKGRIQQVTASARSIKGAPAVFSTLDQTEEWVPSNNGPMLAQNLRTNSSKNGGRTVEAPNAYIPGDESVAEETANWMSAIDEGRARLMGLLYDHREAPADTDMTDHDSLIAGLRYVYGDSSGHPDGCVLHEPACPPGHVDLESQISRIWDPATDPQVARSDYLNQITHASDQWVSAVEWNARDAFNPLLNLGVKPIEAREQITMGFDGSRGRERGRADATALIGCRVKDGHIFTIGIWEPPERVKKYGQEAWEPPAEEVDAMVRWAFKEYRVVGFLADPHGWTGHVAAWEAQFGVRLRVNGQHQHPIQAWPRGRDVRMVEWVKRTHDAIKNGEMTHDGHPVLMRHTLNARRRNVPQGYLLYKSYPDSPNKIDAAYAMVLAWQARLQAIAMGIGRDRKPKAKKAIVMS